MNAFFEHHQHSIRLAYRCFDRLLLNGLSGFANHFVVSSAQPPIESAIVSAASATAQFGRANTLASPFHGYQPTFKHAPVYSATVA